MNIEAPPPPPGKTARGTRVKHAYGVCEDALEDSLTRDVEKTRRKKDVETETNTRDREDVLPHR